MSGGTMPKLKKDGLPRRVYRNHGAFYYVDKANKWHHLGRDEASMYRELAKLTDDVERVDLMAQILARYQRDVLPEKAPKTQRDQTRQLKRLKKVFGRMRAGDITRKHVVQYRDRRGGVAANRELALLSHVFTMAIDWGLADDNPCRGVRRNREAPADRYVTDEEFWARWQQVQGTHPLALLMELLLITGQRLGDVLRIRRSDCTDDGILIRQGKTGTALMLRWTPLLEDVVRRCQQTRVTHINPPLIRRLDGDTYTVQGIGSMWRRVPWGDVKRFTLRDLRAKSASDHPDGAHLGHKDARTLERFYLRKPKEVQGL